MLCGPWLAYTDANGAGFAQPDIVVYDPAHVLWVFEAKLSQTPHAWAQLERLYLPLLARCLPAPRYCAVQVCKVLTDGGANIAAKPAELVDGATWHWLGGGVR